MTQLLVFAILICSCWGFPVDEATYRADISHLQDEVNLLKANLSAVWEKLHEHDELLHVTTAAPHTGPIRTVYRNTRRFRVKLNFFMDIPDHPGDDGSVVVQEFDRDHPFKSVLRQTRDFNVTMNFFLDVPDEPVHEPTPVRTAVRQTSRWRVHFNIFLDIPEHPGQPGAVTTQVVDPNTPVRSVIRETRDFRVHLDFFVDAEDTPEPVISVFRETRDFNVNMNFFVDISDHPGEPAGAIIPVFNGTSPIRSVTRTTRRFIVHFDFFMDIPEHPTPPEMHYAHCEIEPNSHMVSSLHHRVHGSIRISQQGCGTVHMELNLSGFNTSEDLAHHRHGLQIHEYGDMSQGCGSVGELYHYEHAPNHENPGDLGDIVDDASGAVHSSRAFDWLHIDLTDGILGRSLVILQGDHNHPDSEQIACCVIGRAQAH
uniref:Extracellular superoxide dismutase [Cu-Zn] n=1 Tax=Magallana gigas TaxID=29159 RepID=K1QPY8_MAGGI|eukprot:XP_011414396.1 PREDICTED: uncharacterized protein LOC105318810 [Crassostrea gigas]